MATDRRILLVEDFEDSRFSLSKLLEIEGYQVTEAIDGAQAVELAVRTSPDLILMDLSLPVMDGYEATRLIRQKAGMQNIPIIALSGHDLVDFRSEAKAAGCTECLAKPVDFDELLSVLTRHLQQ